MPEQPAPSEQGQQIDIPLKSERKQPAPAAGIAYVILGFVIVGAIVSAFFWLLGH